MEAAILNPEIQEFINANIGADISKLALSKNPFPNTDWLEIVNQVAAKTKAKEKLPNWFRTENIIYPSKISVEQTSSEKTALYKSQLVSGNLIDLTGGFGVDDYYFAQRCTNVIHCEINPELSAIAKHNFGKMNVANVECQSGDSHKILKNSDNKFDWIYIDPSRRNEAKGKVFMLKDCLPDVPGNLESYFTFSDHILIKTAPLLDITAGLNELSNVKCIHIVAVKNEVKELVWELEKGYSAKIIVKTFNFATDKNEMFDFERHSQSQANYSLPEKYLFEPNAAIMKSGGFDEISVGFNVCKLHKHSHLYTSDHLIDFPGRIFEIHEIISYGKSEMKQLPKKANLTARNFPDSVEVIRKKWKIAEGGAAFCFFTTDMNNNKTVLICTKINPDEVPNSCHNHFREC
jgi:16S rRNA G966 N2-methylase RsmD